MSEMTRIQSIPELDPILEASRQQPVFIFKHSLTCPVSTAAFNEYKSYIDSQAGGDRTLFTLVEVQNARDVSGEIAQRTGVRHESPQALLFVDGEVVWHASHWSIKTDSLGQARSEQQA